MKCINMWVTAAILSSFVLGCQQNTNTKNSGATKIRANSPSSLNAQLCRAYISKKKYARAMGKCNKSLSQNARNSDAHKWIAILHQTLGDDKLAGKHFNIAVSLAPRDSLLQNNYGVFLLRKQQYRLAEQAFLKAAKNPLYGARELAYTNAGISLLGARDKEKAEFYFRQAISINSRFPPPLYNLAKIYLDKKRYSVANVFIERWSENSKWTSSSLWIAIQVATKLKDNGRAASLGLLLKNEFPTSKEAMLYLSVGSS